MSKTKKQRKKAAQLKKQEKQFFMWAGIITLVTLAVIYIFFINS